MTARRSILLISVITLILAAFIPAVSATIIFDEQKTFSVGSKQHEWAVGKISAGTASATASSIYFGDIQEFTDLEHWVAVVSGSVVGRSSIAGYANESIVPVVGTIGDDVIFTGRIGHNINYKKDGSLENVIIWIEDIKDFNCYSYTGSQLVCLTWDTTKVPIVKTGRPMSGYESQSSGYIPAVFRGSSTSYILPARYEYLLNHITKNDVGVVWNDAYIDITLKRYGHYSRIVINETDTDNLLISTTYSTEDLKRSIPIIWLYDYDNPSIDISLELSGEQFLWRVAPYDEPDEPGDIMLRTGTVTMTDHNGTSISGFEVTAVNYYTGEEYTVSTDTDVAVVTLPMDRTTEIRNPQTGVYEVAPVGYYTFYGHKPGYKMLHEDGIRVRVMPEKYGSYKLCDILVSSDSGPLTGKHKFQIRSRSDFSVLQTGTISAKSATTGICYNTTVVDGLATLILPYDTSDALSEHAGHYYVYATSPGYEDSDYGTQIIVTPQTVSEVKTILLTPIGGVPTPGNVTLRIQAISETGQSVANAEIFIAGVLGAGKDVWDTYTMSWTGFLEVSVPGNSTYDIVARGAGYYDSSRRIEVFTEDPPIIEMYLYLSGAPTVEPTTEPTGWPTVTPTTQPTSGIPDEDDGSGGFLMEAVRGIGNLFGVGFATAKIILGMLLALSIGFTTAKQLRGGAAEFGLGLLGGTILGILIGLIPVWIIVVLLLVVGLYIGNRYVGGGNNG